MLYTWGRGRHGVLGHGDDERDVELPRLVSAAPRLKQIACGELHCVGLATDGGVFTWGCGLMGALGHGELGTCHVPTPVAGLRKAGPMIEVAAGRSHSLALSASGDVYSWGMYAGMAADCEPEPRRQPDLGGHVRAIGSGDEYCAALTAEGAVASPGP
ncbi:putative e3 ubiquitin-protein ligase herc3 [Chrysochromulina tobinii]|uniref:Putative e3 ubiquitin-protein ligase herc3 n=1 Tax=Chrysochromulina tobinii TaxID=1460289 RepID=A0A0M0LPB1_9EUKA|nr:putative e3 ubiquitin-protein ligase herc3 [Chrysochromulina tobinii]|eukprot:KOO52905.1 putative e3 ubiquitin-protein ligase herc3 [Chrysochromulina sp. CCMP291]